MLKQLTAIIPTLHRTKYWHCLIIQWILQFDMRGCYCQSTFHVEILFMWNIFSGIIILIWIKNYSNQIKFTIHIFYIIVYLLRTNGNNKDQVRKYTITKINHLILDFLLHELISLCRRSSNILLSEEICDVFWNRSAILLSYWRWLYRVSLRPRSCKLILLMNKLKTKWKMNSEYKLFQFKLKLLNIFDKKCPIC